MLMKLPVFPIDPLSSCATEHNLSSDPDNSLKNGTFISIHKSCRGAFVASSNQSVQIHAVGMDI